MLDDEEDLGYVKIDDFVQLQNCFDDFSKSHKTCDQNVTMLTELTTNFIKIHSPPDAGHVPMPPWTLAYAGNPLAVPPPHSFSTHAVSPPHFSLAHASTHAASMQDTHMVFV